MKPVETRHKIEPPLGGVTVGVHRGHLVAEVFEAGLAHDVEEIDHLVMCSVVLDETGNFVGGEHGGFHGLDLFKG